MQTSGDQRREIAKLYQRHCERSEAIHVSICGAIDCFAALAMTWREQASLVACTLKRPRRGPRSAGSHQRGERDCLQTVRKPERTECRNFLQCSKSINAAPANGQWQFDPLLCIG